MANVAERHFNPFQAVDISVPSELHSRFAQYCQTGGNAIVDRSPFPRMVDLWFLGVCLAARLGLQPIDIAKDRTTKIIDGSIFGNDPWRIDVLLLVAIDVTQDIRVVEEPRRVMALANGLAVAGLPKIIDMLSDGDSEPIWNISDTLDRLLRS